jgi:hypothetical protein
LKSGRGLAALALLLSACGDRPGAPAATPPAARTQAATQAAALKDGAHTAQARKRVAELASADARVVSEAQQALMRLGRDAVPALVETLQGAHDARVKQLAAWMLGELGVSAEASLPVLQSLKLTGPSDVSALAASTIIRIQQWQSCGLVGLPEAAEVHLVGLYKGGKELDVQLGTSGHTTTEIDVVVDRTPVPIILVLSAYDPVVWKVGTARGASLAGVLVSGYHTQALIGIPRATPHRILASEQSQGCEAVHAHSASNAAQAERRVMALVGRGIDRYYGGSSGSVVYVGSDSAVAPVDVAYSSDLTLDDYAVVRGEIPAGDRGIDALQRQGKLRPATAADVASWAGDSAQQSRLASGLGVGSVYVVLDEITLPPGLFGAHRRDLIIPSGVPRPKGPKAHCTFYYLKDHTFE